MIEIVRAVLLPSRVCKCVSVEELAALVIPWLALVDHNNIVNHRILYIIKDIIFTNE